MKFSPEVTAALGALTDVLDDPAIDISHTFDQLAEIVLLAVPSTVGLSVRSGTDGAHLELSGARDDTMTADIGASLMITLASVGLAAISTTIVLYATAKGAFVDLAADVAWLTRTQAVDIVLDAHLVPPAYPDPQATLEAMSSVGQAIGMLLGLGYTPEHAERHIHERAALTDVSPRAAADLIISELIQTRPVLEPGEDSL